MTEEPKKKAVVENITNNERLIFVFQTLIKEGERRVVFEENVLVINEKKLNVKPYFDCKNIIELEEELHYLLLPIKDDLDFFRKHDMRDYKPIFSFEWSPDIMFHDYTDEFMKMYLDERLGVKTKSKSTSIKDKIVEFNEVTSTVIIDGKKCPLPPATNMDYLARAMFSREVGEPVDWSIIYREMTGSQAIIGSKKNKKSVEDAVHAINQKVLNILGIEDKLICFKNKSVIRNH